MGMKELRDEISEEVSTILASDFQIEVVETDTVPHSSDGAITFPNLDGKRQGTKLIDTCVLYIDIRRSTSSTSRTSPRRSPSSTPSIRLRQVDDPLRPPQRRARARDHRRPRDGHLRPEGLLPERSRVRDHDELGREVRDQQALQERGGHLRDRYRCGEDARHQDGYPAQGIGAVQLPQPGVAGTPANIASKLTDLANKPEDSFTYTKVNASFISSTGPGILSGDWGYREISAGDFVRQLDVEFHTGKAGS